jgi:hypothetical protein
MLVAAATGEHMGVGDGVGVLLFVGVGVGVGATGVPAQMTTLTIENGDCSTTLLGPPPPPPQLHMNAKATNDTAGTTTRHLRNHSIAH